MAKEQCKSSGTVQLRVLTRNSVMGFGQYAPLSVQQVLDIHKNEWLIGCYFGLGRISFTDEVLTALGFTESDKINKPGSLKKGQLHPIHNLSYGEMVGKCLRQRWDALSSKESRCEIRSKSQHAKFDRALVKARQMGNILGMSKGALQTARHRGKL